MRTAKNLLRAVDRLLAWPFIGFIRLYRLLVSPLYGNTCRFHPSCSAYGLEAFQRLGLVRGITLTTWRVLRCNPWNAGGVDLVPHSGDPRAGVGVARVPGAEPGVSHDLGAPDRRHAA